MFSLPTEPGSIGHTLDAGFKLYFVSFKQVLILAILAALSVSVPMHAMLIAMPMFSAGDGAPGNTFIATFIIAMVVCMALYLCFYLATLCRIGAVAYGQTLTLGTCMAIGARKLFPVILATILYSLAMMGGLLLLIIPGMILWLTLLFYALCIVLEGDGILESLRHSHRLVWGNWWRTAAIVTVVFVVYYVIYLAVEVPFAVVEQMIFDPEPGALPSLKQTILSLIGDVIATVLTFPLMTSVFVAVFHDLKLRKEGHDLEARVDALTVSA